MDNGQVRTLAGNLLYDNCNQEFLDKAIENIKSYSIFIGIHEHYSQSIEFLTRFLQWKQKPIELMLNKGNYKLSDIILSDNDIEKFKEKNKYDYYLYNMYYQKFINMDIN